MRRGGIGLELGLLAFAALCFAGSSLHERIHPSGFKLTPRTEGTLRIVSWNVGTGLDAGGEALRDEDLDPIGDSLRALDPNVIVLQEVRSVGQVRRLRSRLEGSWNFAINRSGSRHVAALARSAVLEEFPLPAEVGTGRALGFRVQGLPESFAFVALHADAFSADNRNKEIGMGTAALLEQREAAGRVLLGDLNLDLDIDKRRDLFTDDEYLDIETYNYATERLVDTGLGRGPTAEPDRRLDYILIEAPSFSIGNAGPWLGQRSKGMDHDPLVLDLERP